MTVLARRKVDGVAECYGVDLSVEEDGRRLVQHVAGAPPLLQLCIIVNRR